MLFQYITDFLVFDFYKVLSEVGASVASHQSHSDQIKKVANRSGKTIACFFILSRGS